MGADDVEPNRLAAAQEAARDVRRATSRRRSRSAWSPSATARSSTQQPTDNRERRARRDRPAQGRRGDVARAGHARRADARSSASRCRCPTRESDEQPPALGYFPSATMVLLSDGEDTGGPDPIGVAQLAAGAGVHVSTHRLRHDRRRGDRERGLPGGHGARRADARPTSPTSPAARTTRPPARRGSDLDQICRLRSTCASPPPTSAPRSPRRSPCTAIVPSLLGGGLLMLRWSGGRSDVVRLAAGPARAARRAAAARRRLARAPQAPQARRAGVERRR